jgi:Divergent InlB B-repeat domain
MRQAGRRGDWTHARTRGALLAAIAALAPLALLPAPAAGQTRPPAPSLTGTPAGQALALASASAAELFELEVEVEVEGFGSGTVTSSPPGIDACGPSGGHACHANFEKGTSVILTATAGPDTEFVEWEGCRAAGAECKVKMSEEREVTAIFDTYPELEVQVEGLGNGTVTSSPPGIDACAYAGGHACEAYFKKGTTVTLTPTAEPGSEFVEWEGCTKVVGSKCEIAMSEEEQEVTAIFALEPELEVELEVEGTGSGAIAVTSSPPGIDCGPGSSACTAPFAGGSTVTLTADAKSSSKFVEWKGCPDAVGAECKVTLSKGTEEEMLVTAVFDAEPLPEHPLTVFIAGEGEVELNPGAIKCSASECKHELEEGSVTLTARQKAGSEYAFSGWTGCEKPSGPTCTIELTGASEVTAVFVKTVKESPEGPPNNEGANGEAGAPDGGGEKGAQGETNANGATAATSAQSPAGPAGPAGMPGPAVPARELELATCKTVTQKSKSTGAKKVQKCTTRLVTGTTPGAAKASRAMLSRHGQTYATGTARTAHGRLRLRLLPLRKLRPGRYTLELITGSGAHERIRREACELGV